MFLVPGGGIAPDGNGWIPCRRGFFLPVTVLPSMFRGLFRWKGCRDDNRQKTMTVEGAEFIRRFLIHVLPDGFHRIRHYGFLSNSHRARNLAHCREPLGMASVAPTIRPLTTATVARH